MTRAVPTRRPWLCRRSACPHRHAADHVHLQLLGPVSEWIDHDDDDDESPAAHPFGSDAGVYISSCGHAMHVDCFARFQASAAAGAVLPCPLCQAASNTTLPVLVLHVPAAPPLHAPLDGLRIIRAALNTYPVTALALPQPPQPAGQ